MWPQLLPIQEKCFDSKGTMAEISVIIPFFQKQPGILIHAVLSVLSQRAISATIVVVDDQSPISARAELADILGKHPGRIIIIEQKNAGPAAARNRGLDNVPPNTDYVAFLDSDDVWVESHLENAVAVLGQGYDFYFSDHFQLNQTISAFNRAKRIQPQSHPAISGDGNLREYSGDMFDQILTGNIIGTSTVVYCFAKFPRLRFREEFLNAGEDYLFWLELSTMTKRIAFSLLCECRYGEGVNIFAGSGWGTEKSLVRLHYEIKFKKALSWLFPLSATQSEAVSKSIWILRRSFAADLLHRLLHRKPIGKELLKAHLKVDPQSFLYFLPLAAMAKMGI